MYHLAVVVLLALAILKITDVISDIIPFVERFRSLLALALSLVTVVWLDYSLFDAWGVEVRNADLGTWVTAFVVFGLTVPWRAVFGYLTHDRATGDESLGVHTTGLFRKAA
jgi:hypothetical protein